MIDQLADLAAALSKKPGQRSDTRTLPSPNLYFCDSIATLVLDALLSQHYVYGSWLTDAAFKGGPNGGPMGPKYAQESYNQGRPNGFRPDSYNESRGVNNGMSRPDSYYDNNSRPSNGYYPSRARYPRTASEPQFNNNTTIYPAHGVQQSYETVTTASGSGSSGDPLGYSTDPSSDNSSLDRIQPPSVPEHNFANGLNNYGGTQNNQVANYASNGYGGYSGKQGDMPVMNGGYQGPTGGPPPPPRKESVQGPPRVPIKLGSSGTSGQTTYEPPRPAAGEKGKSWFGKRFSKG
jgi:hypothetical protein